MDNRFVPPYTIRPAAKGDIEQIIAFALATFAPPALRVTIAAFNRRAQRVWQHAGFVEVGRFGRERDQMPFIMYMRSTTSLESPLHRAQSA
ncbi:MAG TPA: hypothetical protein P5121_22920 [Caldilineaceae bacterium]|nr:hypothetical protein [Caldilineaceae bacterium]